MTAVGWAWFTWAVLMTAGCGFLWWRLEAERKRNLELQDQRVKDALHAYGRPAEGYQEPEIDKVDSPEEAGQKAVRELEKDMVVDGLRRLAEEEGRDVSDSRLEEDARKMLAHFGTGPRSPNV